MIFSTAQPKKAEKILQEGIDFEAQPIKFLVDATARIEKGESAKTVCSEMYQSYVSLEARSEKLGSKSEHSFSTPWKAKDATTPIQAPASESRVGANQKDVVSAPSPASGLKGKF